MVNAADAPVSTAILPPLMDVLASAHAGAADVARVAGNDAGLAARVLALANSASFGLSRQVVELGQAVSLVGCETVRTIAVAGACDLLDGASGLPGSATHAVATACASRRLSGRAGVGRGEAFAAGLLHDLGEILLWQKDPGTYRSAHAGWTDVQSQLRDERGLFGADHALVARERLIEWRLPGPIVDAVGDHHRPDLHHRDLSTVVAAAEALLALDQPGAGGPLAAVGVDDAEAAELRRLVLDEATELAAVMGVRDAVPGTVD